MNYPIESLKEITTPFYCYDMALLRATLDAMQNAADYSRYHIHYALKANVNEPILKTISSAGLGADVVSGGELRRALECGFDPGKIVFSGVGKSDEEIRLSLKAGISCLNVESAEELEVIGAIASEMNVKAPVALRINPEIDAHTHRFITTGLAENKFGIALSRAVDIVKQIVADNRFEFKGVHFHIGSQLTDMKPYEMLCQRIIELRNQFDALGIFLPTINVGGGLGIDYNNPCQNTIPDFKSYFDVFRTNLPLQPRQELHFELGRSIVAQCGMLISKVLYVKQGTGKKFMIIDAGMTDLIRPALYQAYHSIENITSTSDRMELYDIVGPICESSDTFATDREVRETHRGDLIAILSAGAYGQVMASQYNCRPIADAIYIN